MSTTKAATISQHKMRRFLELKAAVKEFEALKEEVKAMMKAKVPQQPGRYQFTITKSGGKRTPSWKDEFLTLRTQVEAAGGADSTEAKAKADEAAEAIIKKTKPGADSYSVSVVDTQAL